MKRFTCCALAALCILALTTVCFAQDAASTRGPITDQSDPRAVLFAEDNNLETRLPEESTPKATPKMPLSTSTNKPNIIFILTDDQPPNTIGLAGNSVIRTPNINSLGQQGVYFNNMYLPIGQCAPSRASILTGKVPHTHGVIGNQVILPPNQLTLSEILQANGYATAIIGKCHLGIPTNPEKYKRGFDFRLIPYPDTGVLTNWYNYQVSRNGAIENHTEYFTDFITTEAVKYLTSAASTGQPFFMWVSYTAPHMPTTPPRGSNRYTLDQMPVPSSIADDLSSKPPQQYSSSSHQDYLTTARGGNPIPTLKSRLKDAYETISNIDDNVGRITQKLQELGIKDNTVVVFMSDNGVFFGEHQLYVKGPFFYEEQIKSPFIFSYPPLTTQGRTSSALATSIDIMPTILDLIGAPVPQDVQGKSFLGVLSGAASDYRSSIFMEYAHQALGNYPMRGVLSGGYKLVHYLASTNGIRGETYDGRDFELYDLRADPSEMNNILKRNGAEDNPLTRLLTDPLRGRLVQKLRKEMAFWQTNTLDPERVTINNMGIVNVGSDSAELQWKTARPTTSEIEYVEANCIACAPSEITSFDFVNDHRVPLQMLTPNTTYKVRVYSIDSTGNGSYVDTLLTPEEAVVDPQADLLVTQTDAPDPAVSIHKIAYDISITNQGPHAARALELIDTLPDGAVFVSATSIFGNCAFASASMQVKCSIGYLDKGATVKVTINTTPTSLGTNTNKVAVSSIETDPDTSNNAAAQDTQVLIGLKKFALSAPVNNGCQNLTGTITLSNPAPDGGTVVTLDDTLAAVTVPVSLTVPAGNSSISFPIMVAPFNASTQQSGTITVNLNGKSLGASLAVRPNTVQLLTLSENTVVGPGTVVGTVTLQCPASPGGTVVTLSSSSPTVANATVRSITIPAGSRSLNFNVRTNAVSVAKTASIYATANGLRKAVALRVNPRPASRAHLLRSRQFRTR